MANDSILALSPGGVLKVSTPDGSVSVRLGHVSLQIVAAMCKSIVGDPTTKDLRLARYAECLPVQSSAQFNVKRAHRTVRVRR